MLLDLIHLAFKRIKSRMLESVVVILGIGFGLAIVSTVLGILISFHSQIEDMGNNPWQRSMYISPSTWGGYYEPDSVTKIGTVDNSEQTILTYDDMIRFKEYCPSIDYAFIDTWVDLGETEEELEKWWEIPYGQGANNEYIEFLGLEIDKGSLFSQEDIENQNNVMILGGNISKILFEDRNPVGETLHYKDTDYMVIGVLEENYNGASAKNIEERKDSKWDDNNRIYLPYTLAGWIEDSSQIKSFSLGIKEGGDLRKAINEVKLYISSQFPNSDLTVKSSLDEFDSMIKNTVKVLTIIAFVAFTCLIIASLTNLNLMLARVIREKKGLGISIALGSSKKTLFSSILIESSLMGVIGAIVGITLTAIFSITMGVIMDDFGAITSSTMGITNILINIGLAVFITALFSVIPAIEALRVPTSQVLRED